MPAPANTPSPALARFVTGGLLDTVESFRLGTLPLHRFAWELRTRIDSLAGLAPSTRALTRLRWLERDVGRLHATLAETGRTELTSDEQAGLGATLAGLRTVLGTVAPHDPLDPSGAARPAGGNTPATGAARPAAAGGTAAAATGAARPAAGGSAAAATAATAATATDADAGSAAATDPGRAGERPSATDRAAGTKIATANTPAA